MTLGQMFNVARLAAAKALTPIPKSVPIAPRPAPRISQDLSFAQRQIDLDFLCLAFPQNKRKNLEQWVKPAQDACYRWGIDTFREVASFFANISVESAGLTRLEENLNYSARRMAEVWPGRYAIGGKAANGPNALAHSLAHNPEKLANNVYANRMGNGPPASGDGWRHRGAGPKQTTGKKNQQAFADAAGIPLADVPAYIRTPEGGMMAAGYYWKANNLDAKAVTPGWKDDRIAINGGTIGLAAVDAMADDLIEELLRREQLQ